MDVQQWWPESPADMYIAAIVPPVGGLNRKDALGYVIVRATQISNLSVVVSEYGNGAIYPNLERAQAYHDALTEIIKSRAYKTYKEKSRQVLEAHGIS